MKQKLLSIYVSFILDNRVVRTGHRLAELRRLLTMKKRTVTVFLQLDDPYSYLLSYYLDFAIKRYKKVEFRFMLCQALRGEYNPEPAMQSEYAAVDCALLADEFGIPFLDVGETPAVEHRRALLDFLAEEQDEEGFAQTLISALSVYWRGDTGAVARMLGRPHADSTETSVLVGKNQLLLRKMGHYNSAMMHYAGEWYWGVDRLQYLLDQFELQKLNRFKEPTPELASLQQARRVNLPATAPAAASKPVAMDMFHSFASPYSYLALNRAFAIADAFGVKLAVRPVLPMPMRGVPVPKAKLLYILKDANREAQRLEVPFGKIANPMGSGVERCIAGFYYAVGENRQREFLWAAGQAIFARGIDVATDEGLEIVADRSGLFWPDMKEALKDESWRDKVVENRQDLLELGLWGVPSFHVGGLAMWGQDRDWLLVRKIEDLCAGGEGIME